MGKPFVKFEGWEAIAYLIICIVIPPLFIVNLILFIVQAVIKYKEQQYYQDGENTELDFGDESSIEERNSFNNEDPVKQKSLDSRYMHKKDDIFEIKHFVINKFNIEFDITSDFLIDPVRTMLLVGKYTQTIVAHFLMKDTENGFTMSYVGKNSLKSLKESTLETWVNEATPLGNCYYRKSVEDTMVMYGISFFNNDNYTIAYKPCGVNKQIFDKCIENIIQTMSILEPVKLTETDQKTLIKFCDDAYSKLNYIEYKNFSYYCKQNNLTKKILEELYQNIKNFNLGNEYLDIIKKYLN